MRDYIVYVHNPASENPERYTVTIDMSCVGCPIELAKVVSKRIGLCKECPPGCGDIESTAPLMGSRPCHRLFICDPEDSKDNGDKE